MHARFLFLLASPGLALAASGEPARIEPALPGGGLLAQLSLGLAAVLVLAIGLMWLLRRFAQPRNGIIQVLGGLPLGTRERLLLVEVDQVRLLLGITPNRIQALYVFASVPAEPAIPLQPERDKPATTSPEPSHDRPPL